MPDSYPFAQRYTLTSGYGQRTYTLNGKVITDFHRGVDYGTPKRTPILAPFDCIVDQYIDSSQAKYCVLIRKGTNYRWDIIHVDEVVGPVGREAKQGTVVGYTGNTGKYTTGPHAHIEIRPDWINGKNVYIDPTSYLQNLPLFSELNPPQPPVDPCADVKAQLAVTEAKLSQAQQQLSEAELELERANDIIDRLQDDVEALEKQLKDAEKQYAELQVEKDKLQESNEKLRAENDALLEVNAKLIETNAMLERKLGVYKDLKEYTIFGIKFYLVFAPKHEKQG